MATNIFDPSGNLNYRPNVWQQQDWQTTQPVAMTNDSSGGGSADWWSQNAPPQTQTGGGNPFSAGMSPEQFRNALNQFAQSRGYGPVSDSSYNTWQGYYNQYGQNDPNYLWMRLQDTGEFGGRDTYGAGGGGGSAQSILAQLQSDPGYQARLAEGQKGMERSAASRGTLLTGGFQKALDRYSQDYASNELQNAFNRNLSLAQLGMGATGGIVNAAGQYGQQAAGDIVGQGNAGAAGTVGGANAWMGTLGQLGQLGAGYASGYPYRQQPYPPYILNSY